MRRRVPLKQGKPLKRSRIRRQSQSNKGSKRKRELIRVLSLWCRADGICFKCGGDFGVKGLHAHHIFTRGSHPELALCPDNVVPVCPMCHHDIHANPAQFEVWLESQKTGIVSHLTNLARGQWRKRHISEVEAILKELPPWSEHWDSIKCS